MAGAVDETHVPHELVLEPVHGERVLVAGAPARVAHGPLALLVEAPVDLGVGVAQLDCDVPLELVLEPDGVHAGQGLDEGGLAVGHVADGADVDRGLEKKSIDVQI